MPCRAFRLDALLGRHEGRVVDHDLGDDDPSCRTLLCLRLCSSAPGTTSVREDRNTAVPATRKGVFSARSRNNFSGIESLRMVSRCVRRPSRQVSMIR